LWEEKNGRKVSKQSCRLKGGGETNPNTVVNFPLAGERKVGPRKKGGVPDKPPRQQGERSHPKNFKIAKLPPSWGLRPKRKEGGTMRKESRTYVSTTGKLRREYPTWSPGGKTGTRGGNVTGLETISKEKLHREKVTHKSKAQTSSHLGSTLRVIRVSDPQKGGRLPGKKGGLRPLGLGKKLRR